MNGIEKREVSVHKDLSCKDSVIFVGISVFGSGALYKDIYIYIHVQISLTHVKHCVSEMFKVQILIYKIYMGMTKQCFVYVCQNMSFQRRLYHHKKSYSWAF